MQLLENASRAGDKTYVRGLATCVEKDLKLGFMGLHRWIKTKKEVILLFWGFIRWSNERIVCIVYLRTEREYRLRVPIWALITSCCFIVIGDLSDPRRCAMVK